MRKIITILFPVVVVAAGCFNVVQGQSNSIEAKPDKVRAEALKLINLPEPTFKPFVAEKIDSQKLAEAGFERVYSSTPTKFKMKDGKNLFADYFALNDSRLTVVLLHGVVSNAARMNETAGLLREAAGAEIFALDLRGHGRSDGKPGDVDYIDQYAADLAQVIAQIRKHKPRNKIVLAGHSMGGGISLRYAMLKDAPAVDGFLLFASLLGQNAPTFPLETAANGASEREPFLKIHISRLIGLKMLNSIGEHRHDALDVLFFNVPENAPIRTYTYRASESMSPVDYRAGLKSIRAPLLVLVGSRDEAFNAKAFDRAIKANSEGEIFVIEGANHDGIRHNPESLRLIHEWLAAKIVEQR